MTPTLKPPNGRTDDRTAYLKDILKYPMTKDDLIPVVREMARIIIAFDEDIHAIPQMRDHLASLNQLIVDFMHDQLQTRKEREEEDREVARVRLEKATEKLKTTSTKLSAVDVARARAASQNTVPSAQDIITPPHPVVLIWMWFRDKVLPWFVTGATAFILLAIWEAIRAKILNP